MDINDKHGNVICWFTSAIIVSKAGNENWIYFDFPIWFYISTIVI